MATGTRSLAASQRLHFVSRPSSQKTSTYTPPANQMRRTGFTMLNKYGFIPNHLTEDNIQLCQVRGEARRARTIVNIDHEDQLVATYCGEVPTGFIDAVRLPKVRFFNEKQQQLYWTQLGEIKEKEETLKRTVINKTVAEFDIPFNGKIRTFEICSLLEYSNGDLVDLNDVYLLLDKSESSLLRSDREYLDYRPASVLSMITFEQRLEKVKKQPTLTHLAELIFSISVGEEFNILNIFQSDDWIKAKITSFDHSKFLNLNFKKYTSTGNLFNLEIGLNQYNQHSLQNGYYPKLKKA
ncbi:hypothetical protein [Photobacterium leiognathi]|uniref:hypothetical protein n=1 Tax=Photobacterium leiognathi TaxID=553611 RepID=UPI0027399604|nr:hypothetical protein [Photobacterium leiognathi]